MPTPPRSDLRRERVVHKAANHEAAAAWDREQQVRMTPDERRCAARTLRLRAFPPDSPDIRACRDAR